MARATWIGFALGLLLACDLSEELEGEPCAVDEDCWHTQTCVRTPEERERGLVGMCLAADTDCAFGQQLGCTCDPEDFAASCSTLDAQQRDEAYPEMTCDPDQRLCVEVVEEES
jgi:hypothetical protein